MKIGIDLGGSHIGIGVVDTDGNIVEKFEKRIVSKDRKNVKKVIEEYIIEKSNLLLEKYKISSIGIAVPGTVQKDIIIKSVNFNLENYKLVERLKQVLNIEIKLKNDAKCAALAENKYGAGKLKNSNRILFLTLGTGIGGAVIINNKLLDTGDEPGCEFGHMIIQKNGIMFNCGKKGCFERYASMKAFKDNLREVLGLDEKTSGKELLNIIRKTTQKTQNYLKINRIINNYIEDLSIGISNIINIFEPESIILGGSFVFYEEIFLAKLKEKLLNSNLLFNKRKGIDIQTAILGNDAGIIGATLI